MDLTALPRRLEVDRAERRRADAARTSRWPSSTSPPTPHGLRLPPDPSSGRWATLGGMVSTNAAGARSVRYGSVRRWVEAVELVTADGEVAELRRGARRRSGHGRLARLRGGSGARHPAAAAEIAARFPRTRKNSSGYALDALARHRRPARPGHRRRRHARRRHGSRVAAGPDPRHARGGSGSSCARSTPGGGRRRAAPLRAVGDRAARPDLPRAGRRAEAPRPCCWSSWSAGRPRRCRAAVTAAAKARAAATPGVDTGLTPEAARRLWALRHAASPILAGLPEERRSLQVIEDGCVPVERMGDYVRAVRRGRGSARISGGDLRPRRRWPHPREPAARGRRPGWEAAVADLARGGHRRVVRLGGTPVGRAWRRPAQGRTARRGSTATRSSLFGRVKRASIPSESSIPALSFPSGEPPIGRLKVGAHAVAASRRHRPRAPRASSSAADTPGAGSSWRDAR